MPLTNVRGECTRPEDGVFLLGKYYERLSTQLIWATVALGLALYLLGAVSKKFALILILVVAIGLNVPVKKISEQSLRKFNCILMRDFDVVEQPIIMENLTVRFTNEAKSFIKKHKEQPFLLFMSYVKVHTSLFTSPKFKGNDHVLTVGSSGGGIKCGDVKWHQKLFGTHHFMFTAHVVR